MLPKSQCILSTVIIILFFIVCGYYVLSFNNANWLIMKTSKNSENVTFQKRKTQILDNYTEWQSLDSKKQTLSANFQRFIRQIHVYCPDILRIGNEKDGGWNICVSPAFAPKKECLVYSLGINYDFSFDTGMVKRFNCFVRSYDPSMEKGIYAKVKQGFSIRKAEHIQFHKSGIGGHTKIDRRGWDIKTFGSMLKQNQEEKKTIDVLKMDVEAAEWESLPVIYKEGSLRNVKQLMFEIHINANNLKSHFETLRQLEKIGFKRYLFHANPLCGRCFELYYINTNYMK